MPSITALTLSLFLSLSLSLSIYIYIYIYIYGKKVKCSRYRPGVAQRVGRVIALLFHDRGTRRGWMVSSTPRPQFTPGKDRVPILQEAWWATGPIWKDGKSRPHRYSIPDRPARSSVAIPTELGPHICDIFIIFFTTCFGLFWPSTGIPNHKK